jgi:uncharacterized protein (TIGR03437 family)
VADPGNNRVLIFNRVGVSPPDTRAVFTIARNLRQPQGVVVSPATGEVWVTDFGNNRMLRYPKFDDLLLRGDTSDATIPASAPLATALDGFGNLLVADSLNRVGIHFPPASLANAANFQPRAAPGMIASLFAGGPDFTDSTLSFNELPNPVPLPTELADTQVLVNDVAAPLYFVSPRQINFLVPSSTPVNASAEVQVVRPSSGQILSATSSPIQPVAPGLFTASASGSGQLSALNQDGAVNSDSNPVPRGQVIQLFGTGHGVIPGAPPDGSPATGPLETPSRPRVFVNVQAALVECAVQYSGFAPGLIGVWQINALIPTIATPNNASALSVIYENLASTPTTVRTTIAIR